MKGDKNMDNSGVTASDVIALTRGNENMFGGVGGFVLLFIFLLALSGNGLGWGGNGQVGQMATADLLYNQSTDSAIRGLVQGQCNITDNILNASYNNLLANKDISNQISNQTLAITNAMQQNTNAIIEQMNTNIINDLRDKLAVTRDALSNANQTAVLTGAIAEQTSQILNAQGRYVLNPPCYYNCPRTSV